MYTGSVVRLVGELSYLHCLQEMYCCVLDSRIGSFFDLNDGQFKSGPSSAFEKWSGHEISKTFYECRRRVGGEHERGHSPSRKGGSGDLPRENFIFPDVRSDDFNALWDNFCP